MHAHDCMCMLKWHAAQYPLSQLSTRRVEMRDVGLAGLCYK
jgi:hypothetical protein